MAYPYSQVVAIAQMQPNREEKATGILQGILQAHAPPTCSAVDVEPNPVGPRVPRKYPGIAVIAPVDSPPADVHLDAAIGNVARDY